MKIDNAEGFATPGGFATLVAKPFLALNLFCSIGFGNAHRGFRQALSLTCGATPSRRRCFFPDLDNPALVPPDPWPYSPRSSQDFPLAVVSNRANHPPAIISRPPLTATANYVYFYPALGSDPDGDMIVWSLDQAPEGMSIDPVWGTIYWTARADQVGSQPVVLRARGARKKGSGVFFLDTVGCLCPNGFMPRRLRFATGGFVYHVLNRAVGRAQIFKKEGDYAAFMRNWMAHVNRPETEQELQALRRAVVRGCPFGEESWQQQTAKLLGLETTLRPRGRPRKQEPMAK
jgi:hypothetical protein